MFNVVYFFSLIGLNNAFTANLIVYCVLLGGVLVSFYLVDKVGRRPLLLCGCAFMSLCVFAVGGIGFTPLGKTAGNALVALVALWVAAYSVSIAPIGELPDRFVDHMR
jgi:MFS family permease